MMQVSLPLGYHQHEKAGGTPVIKMICLNHLRIGRLNNRMLDGPMRLPTKREEQLKLVSNLYSAWFKILQDTLCLSFYSKPIGSAQRSSGGGPGLLCEEG